MGCSVNGSKVNLIYSETQIDEASNSKFDKNHLNEDGRQSQKSHIQCSKSNCSHRCIKEGFLQGYIIRPNESFRRNIKKKEENIQGRKNSNNKTKVSKIYVDLEDCNDFTFMKNSELNGKLHRVNN